MRQKKLIWGLIVHLKVSLCGLGFSLVLHSHFTWCLMVSSPEAVEFKLSREYIPSPLQRQEFGHIWGLTAFSIQIFSQSLLGSMCCLPIFTGIWASQFLSIRIITTHFSAESLSAGTQISAFHLLSHYFSVSFLSSKIMLISLVDYYFISLCPRGFIPCLNTTHLLLEVLLFCAIVIVITLKNIKSLFM